MGSRRFSVSNGLLRTSAGNSFGNIVANDS